MKLAFAMLADSAEATQDGKVSIFGGGIDVVWAHAFPAVHPSLTIVAQLVSEPSDRGKKNLAVVIEGRTPQGTLWFRGEPAPIQWKNPDKAGRPAKHTLIAKIPMLVLPTEGQHTIRLLVNDVEAASFPLWADVVPQPESKSKATRKRED